MSLFKVRQFWCTTTEDNEFFDQSSMIVTRINSDSEYVITGSHSGIFRIFSPNCEIGENGELSGFNANDLLIEKSFDSPILQVGSGKLTSGSGEQQIAILRPKVLSVYSLVTKIGKTEHGNQSFLQLVYEHKLRKSAYNFVIGPFGRIQNRDFICVQSLDGLLMFLEQESPGFHVALPDFLLPAPLDYVPECDGFVTINSAWEIVLVGYKALSDSSIEPDSIYSKPKVIFDWSYQLGEPALDIAVVTSVGESNENWIAVLGERNLFCLDDKGQLKFMKKFEFSPVCFSAYALDDALVSLVISETNTLLIYKNTTLEWSSKLDFLPISVKRAFLKNIKGALVFLGEEGRLECCYLGTEPSIFVAPPLSTKAIDFEKAEAEIKDMEKKLKKQDIDVNDNFEKEFQIHISTNPKQKKTEISEFNQEKAATDFVCPVTIDIKPQVTFQEVQIAIFVYKPLDVEPRQVFFSNFKEETTFKCNVFLSKRLNVPTLVLIVNASVITSLGVPRYLSKEIMLPLDLVVESCSAEKQSGHKITLSLDSKPLELETLFPEYAKQNLSSTEIGFKNPRGEVVLLMLSKNSDRYRLQSKCFASLSLLTDQLIRRLKKHHQSNADFQISLNSPFPSDEVFECIRAHFEVKQRVGELENDLSQLSAQYRLIQKRLMSKLKSKEPTPLKNLELLLNDTNRDIVEVTEKLQSKLDELSESQVNLTCALLLLNELIKLLSTDNNILSFIDSTFGIEVTDVPGQSWEDVAQVNLSYILKMMTSKDNTETNVESYEEVKDLIKLKKYFFEVIETITRLSKEENDKEGSSFIEDSKKLPRVHEDEEPIPGPSSGFVQSNFDINNYGDKENKPINERDFAESKNIRGYSVRQSLLTRRKKLDDKIENSIGNHVQDYDPDDLV